MGFQNSVEILVDRTSVSIPSGANPMEWLIRDGHVFQSGMGQYGFGSMFIGLMNYFDAMFNELSEFFGPDQFVFPSLISIDAMSRCDYFTSFPHSCCFVNHLQEDEVLSFSDRVKKHKKFSLNNNELSDVNYMLSPAVCFHWYNHLSNRVLPCEGVKAVTAKGKCFRYESSNFETLERMWDFTMRELIFVGSGKMVMECRSQSIELWKQRLDKLGMSYTIESATDPFFGIDAEILSKFQSAFNLKYEIRATLPYSSGSLAVGSFNYHQDHFGRAFNIALGDSESACSACTACTAVGLERWAFAFLCQFGSDKSYWPKDVVEFVGRGSDD